MLIIKERIILDFENLTDKFFDKEKNYKIVLLVRTQLGFESHIHFFKFE